MTRTLIGLVVLALSAPVAAVAQTPPGTDDGDYEQVPAGGDVPATLSLKIDAPATFAPFAPGVDGTYEATMTGDVVSTTGDAVLTVADPSAYGTGHLLNGTFVLPQPLEALASSPAGTGGAYAPVGGAASPTPLLRYSGPVSHDAITIGFRQAIRANDALRTGTYAKTLTFTLSTNAP